MFTVQKAECLGACADAPVLLVNDRQMVSFMSDARLDELVDIVAHAAPERDCPHDAGRSSTSPFQATGTETCLHGRHLERADLRRPRRQNWRLKDYEARGGYQAWKKILAQGEGRA